MWVGIVFFLKNTGYIETIDWTVCWPVALIIIGVMMKRGCRGMCFGKGCGMCKGDKCEGGKCEGGKCEGGKCSH